METLPLLPLFKIGVELSFYDLLNLCQTNKRNWVKIWQNELFWKTRAVQVLGYNIKELPEKVDKQWYMDNAGVTYYKVGKSEFKVVANNVKKIFCYPRMTGIIDAENNAFVSHGKQYMFLMKDAIQISENENNDIFVLNKSGELFCFEGNKGRKLTMISEDKVDFIQQDYILANGILYQYDIWKEIIIKYRPHLKGIKFIKLYEYEYDYFVYITENNDLYLHFAYFKMYSLFVANNVKYGNVTCREMGRELMFYIFCTDNKSDLYMTYGCSNDTKTMEKEILENKYFVMKNVLKVSFTNEETYVLTNEHDLYVYEMNITGLYNHKFVNNSVRNIESVHNEVMILVIQ